MCSDLIRSDASGIVFDIQRCSVYDGPGIRTTVFLKGCPLSCKWCHNPESQRPQPQIAFFSEKCAGCGACQQLHPQVHHLNMTASSGEFIHRMQWNQCVQCGRCAAICPTGALKMYGKQSTAAEVIDLVKKDMIYYRETGGGITCSGGEPFLQFPFLLSILAEAKKHGIHTCVETSGYVSLEHLKEAMPYIDLFLFDYKESDPQKHRAFTGVDNRLILDNLDFLYSAGKKIILRCPIIPGYNDTAEHFTGIAEMEKRYPALEGIEILPYHDLGKEKAAAIGAEYEIVSATADETLKTKWKELLRLCGCSEQTLESF